MVVAVPIAVVVILVMKLSCLALKHFKDSQGNVEATAVTIVAATQFPLLDLSSCVGTILLTGWAWLHSFCSPVAIFALSAIET